MWKEFKPALRFLLIFVGLYLAANVIYGLWINSFDGLPDPITRSVTGQASGLLNQFGYQTIAWENNQGAKVFLGNDDRVVLNVFEGCNGINVVIVFVSFLFAFGGSLKKMIWFLPLSLVIIHLSNLARLLLLYFVAIGYHRYFYYVHKYIFTAVMYVIVFALWIVWIAINGKQQKPEAA